MSKEREGPVSDASAQVSTDTPRALTRDERFKALVTKERDRAVRLAYHLVGGDAAMAEDLAQEAFLRAYHALSGFRGEAALSSWFIRILINQAASYKRRQWVRNKWLALWGLGGSLARSSAAMIGDETLAPVAFRGGAVQPPPGDPALRRRMAEALDDLSAGQLRAFVLVYLEGMSLVEAADAAGVAVGTMKSHLHRALTKLRAELSDLRED